MSVFVKSLMDWFMFGMVIETGPKFYMVLFPTQKVTDSEFLYKSFVINVLQFHFFCKAFSGFNQLWHDDWVLSKILCNTFQIPVHDLKIKVTDFELFCVKSLQFQLLESLWLIWIVFGMIEYKILKCFRKGKHVSGELPCLVTGLIILAGNEVMHKISHEFKFRPDRTTDFRVSCPWTSKKFPMDL